MAGSISLISTDDILRWANGTWCYRHELSQYNHMSDDYEVIACNSPDWNTVSNDDLELIYAA